jgi:DNA repair protein RadC
MAKQKLHDNYPGVYKICRKKSPKTAKLSLDIHKEAPPKRVCDMPANQRPREFMEKVGRENVPDDILLAILLRTGTKGVNVVELARKLLEQYGTLTALASAPEDEIAQIKGIGKVKAQILSAAMELAVRLSTEKNTVIATIKSPADAVRLLRDKARTLDKEVFWVLPLDIKNQLKREPICISEGVLDASLAHPREVFRSAICRGAAAIIIAHNHPSGDPTPSPEDIRITREMVEAGKIVDITVLDHIIIGKPDANRKSDYVSIRETGIVDFK